MTQSAWMRLYARGFFLGPQPVSLFEDIDHYRRYELAGYTLYADEITEVGIATDGDDWLITIGKLLPLSTGIVSARGTDIADELMTILKTQGLGGLERALYDLAGRHAMIVKTGDNVMAYNDAAGHRTVYFNAAQQHIASQFDMLHRLTDVQTLWDPVESQRPDAGPDGMWDITENPHVKTLLPNHRLHLQDGTQRRFGLMDPNPNSRTDWADKIETVYQLWHEQLQQLIELAPNNQLGMSLSGGLDSRTVLAHMRPYLNNVRAFTYTAANVKSGKPPTSYWQRTMVTDHNVLDQMTDHLPEDFHVVVGSEAQKLTAEDTAILGRNSSRNHGRRLVQLYKEMFADNNSIHVRGNFVEMGRLIRGQLDIPTQRGRMAPIIYQIGRRRRPNMTAYKAFFWEKIKEFEYDKLHEDIEHTDVYHWENRSSRWYAEIANETDTVFDSIVPVNARRIYEMLISPRRDVRPSAQFQTDLIHRAWPELLAYGINDENDRYTSTLRKHLLEQLDDHAQDNEPGS